MGISYQKEIQVPNQIDSEISSSTMNEYSEIGEMKYEKSSNQEKTQNEDKERFHKTISMKKNEGYSFS